MTNPRVRTLLLGLFFTLVAVQPACSGCAGDPLMGEITEDLSASADDLSSGDSPVDLYGVNLDAAVLVKTDGGTKVCYYATCQGHLYQCGDCIDNDGDGLLDSEDPDCTGVCDNTENSFALGIPGANNAACAQDCYFDQDTGAGNDQCYWNHFCDPHEVPPKLSPEDNTKCTYVGSGALSSTSVGGGLSCTSAMNTQSATCKSVCGPLTPNACDCFGCCTIGPQADAARGLGIWLGSGDGKGNQTCNVNNLGDPDKCKVCQIVPSCYKTCGRCQLCLGDPPTKVLPADCYATPDMAGQPPADMTGQPPADMSGTGDSCPALLCPTGQPPCGLSGCGPCAAGSYCLTGCCVKTAG